MDVFGVLFSILDSIVEPRSLFCVSQAGSHYNRWSPGSLRTHYVDQTGLKLNRDPPTSTSQVLGLKVCATIPGPTRCLILI